MTIYAAILLLSASGSATRTLDVQDSIAGVVVQVVAGGIADVWMGEERRLSGQQRIDRGVVRAFEILSLRLRIDGQPRAGVLAWGTAAAKVAGYVLDCGNDSNARPCGSVGYEYRLRVRGFEVRRHTEISDGHVTLTTDVYGSIGPRAELYHVRLVLDGSELGDGTRLSGTATGWSRIGDRCRLVRRIAERKISEAMSDVLMRIESGGRGMYHAGSAEEMIEVLR